MKSEITLTIIRVNIGKLNRQQYEIRNHINYHKSEHREIEYANISKSEITLTIIRVNILEIE